SSEPIVNIYAASRAFIVSVAPVDEESRQADSSVLYQRDANRGGWLEIGLCRKETSADGVVRFTREIEVREDGTYLYTSRPVVGGQVDSPPTADSPPQARVVVDTLPPTAEIIEPLDGSKIASGQTVRMAWICSDENIASLPASLFYSTDGGRSWHLIARELPSRGETVWNAPEDSLDSLSLRLTAVDLAGNVGRDLRRLEFTVLESQPVVGPPTPIAEVPKLMEDPPKTEISRDGNRAWLYYLMAVNLMRQHKPADALQYYWFATREDPDFIDAWADIGLAYIELGAFRTAREVVEQTRDKAPDRIDLMHLLGETYHAEGMAVLCEAWSSEDRLKAKGLIDQAVEWYGRALERAAGEWRLAEQAASYYRLGEICYYVNMDRDGARAYWKKILELHSPTPNYDLVLWTPRSERGNAEKRYQRYTYRRVTLEAWQNWTRGYLEQLDARERAGILDLMPAQRVSTFSPPHPLSYGQNAMNPGRDDGRSLFSLPGQLGAPASVEAVSGIAPAVPLTDTGNVFQPGTASKKNAAAKNYSFYAAKATNGGVDDNPKAVTRKNRRSTFSGGPESPPPANPDPYAFPNREGGTAVWNTLGPYGDRPDLNW
ncbi:MAG: hypothetical protein FWG74_09745, partial [Planctomycetes bacterium]|nr:hypothetical protein [Planctomycetota bacterium]